MSLRCGPYKVLWTLGGTKNLWHSRVGTLNLCVHLLALLFSYLSFVTVLFFLLISGLFQRCVKRSAKDLMRVYMQILGFLSFSSISLNFVHLIFLRANIEVLFEFQMCNALCSVGCPLGKINTFGSQYYSCSSRCRFLLNSTFRNSQTIIMYFPLFMVFISGSVSKNKLLLLY